jgi:hypothetical protein
LRYLREDQARILFQGFQEGRKRGELKNLRQAALRSFEQRDDAVAIAEIVRSACEGTGVLVEVKGQGEAFPYYEEVAGRLVEWPAICASYPRKLE